jgi:MFS family permease
LKQTVLDYAEKVHMFRPNARLYLMNVITTGVAMGVFRLLFNFYAISLGFDEALLGRLITIGSLTSLLVALPMGYLADILGRKNSLLLSGALVIMAIFGMILIQTETAFYTLQIVLGVAQSLAAITMAPFLMENSGEQELTCLVLGKACKCCPCLWGIGWAATYPPGLRIDLVWLPQISRLTQVRLLSLPGCIYWGWYH